MGYSGDRVARKGRGIVLVLATCSLLAAVALAPGAEAKAFAATAASAQMQVRPTSGPAGIQIDVRARGLSTVLMCSRTLYFEDSAGAVTYLDSLPLTESFRTRATVPATAAPGPGKVYVLDHHHYFTDCGHPQVAIVASAPFTIT